MLIHKNAAQYAYLYCMTSSDWVYQSDHLFRYYRPEAHSTNTIHQESSDSNKSLVFITSLYFWVHTTFWVFTCFMKTILSYSWCFATHIFGDYFLWPWLHDLEVGGFSTISILHSLTSRNCTYLLTFLSVFSLRTGRRDIYLQFYWIFISESVRI